MSAALSIALVQKGPVFLDKQGSLDRALELIQSAAQQGASLVVFPETWLSGYPIWLDISPGVAAWDDKAAKAAYLALYENGIAIPSAEFQRLQEVAGDLGVAVAMGLNETPAKGRGNGSIFNTYVFIDDQGELRVHHRKLMPTHGERLVHAMGDGQGLESVDWQGIQVGGLICWEHWMPLTRQAMHLKGEHLHLALWPQVKEQNHLASRHYALEGRCYVMAVGAGMRYDEWPSDFPLPLEAAPGEEWLLHGGSAVYGPNGDTLLGPLAPDAEMALFNWPGLEALRMERMALDASGHYNRPDVFRFSVNEERY